MSELDEIVSLVVQKTMADRMTWQFDGRSTITAKIGSNIIEIVEVQQDQAHNVLIRNTNGVMLTNEMYISNKGVGATYNKIKRSALGVDEALNDVKNKLRGL